ncbi:uncharacterized protein P884DRAFT_213173, partial [Thermothelomyces heterothallicus CBS 202.75]|uniref:uncharacterized protein n=1 Tax=Thermothelomyces heterothallicus CBS 202.75 TaxID=1149848 RepID=UPI003744A3CF
PKNRGPDLRRVDLVVEKMDSTATTIGTLLFLEAKRASTSRTYIEEVEYQAFTAACVYYVETGLEPLWTMTCVGSAARLWIFSGSSDFLDGLEYFKKHTTPPAELLRKTPSPRPANATLPLNWHDNEVAQLDARRQQGEIVPMAAALVPLDLTQDERGVSYGSGNERFA